MARRARQPSFKALGIDHLPLFLAAYQGLANRGNYVDDLQNCMDQLFGFPGRRRRLGKAYPACPLVALLQRVAG